MLSQFSGGGRPETTPTMCFSFTQFSFFSSLTLLKCSGPFLQNSMKSIHLCGRFFQIIHLIAGTSPFHCSHMQALRRVSLLPKKKDKKRKEGSLYNSVPLGQIDVHQLLWQTWVLLIECK